jgi:Sec-independent protein translocase protein TatA
MFVLVIGFIIAVVVGIHKMNEADRHHKQGIQGFKDKED